MSHFECRLNWRFWHSKKVVQVVQIGGGGGRGNLNKIQKKSNFFFVKPSPSCDIRTWNSKIVDLSLYVSFLLVIFVLWVACMATAVTISSSISDPTIVSIPLSLHPFWPLFVIIFYAMRLLFCFLIVFATLHTFITLTLQDSIWNFTAF